MHDAPAPNSASEFERRLTELETQAAFAEDTLDRLNDVVVRQQGQIDALLRQVARLLQQGPADGAAAPRSLRDDLPPHY